MGETLIIQNQAENHGGVVKAKGRELRCYTKKQLRAFHPGGYELVGECQTADLSGNAAQDADVLRQAGTYSRWKYAKRGYWSCGGNRYVALLAPALPQRLLMLFVCVLVIAGGVLTAVFWPQIAPSLPTGPSVSGMALDPNAQDYTGEKNNYKGNPDAPSTQIPGYKEVSIDAKTGELSIAPHNPEGNPCYFVITLLVEGEAVYKSGMIAPGQALYHVKADPVPEKGSYTATIKYDCFHLVTQNPLNGAEIAVEMEVE